MFARGRTQLATAHRFPRPGQKQINKGAGAPTLGQKAVPGGWNPSSTAAHPTVANAFKSFDKGFVLDLATVHGMPPKKLHAFLTKRGFEALPPEENRVSYRKSVAKVEAGRTNTAIQALTTETKGKNAGTITAHMVFKKGSGKASQGERVDSADSFTMNQNGIVERPLELYKWTGPTSNGKR